MTTDEILCALDALAVQTGSLACLGCGHEHNCGIHGCAIIREAGKIIRWLSTDNTALRYAIKPAKVKRSQEQDFNGAVAYLRALIEEQRAQIEKAEAENAALRKKLAMSDKDVTAAHLYFSQWQAAFNQLTQAVSRIEDEDKVGKLCAAIRAQLTAWGKAMEGTA